MIKALALTGPTASGKTALSLGIAASLGCEIISLDSMQIYKRMDIGTAKATAQEQAICPHHMLDLISPKENFSAKAYKDMAMPIARGICARGKLPFFVGGTGLYLSTVMRPECEEAPESNPVYRRRIEQTLLTEDDRIALWQRLMKVDPESAASVHYNNTRRVIRALEIFDATGKTKTYFDELTRAESKDISFVHITLDFHDRDLLYKRVDERVDIMMNDGLLREVRSLLDDGLLEPSSTAAQAIGYKEIIEAIEGKITLDEAVENLKQASRNYAKRQLTWFRNMKGAVTVFADGDDGSMKPRRILLDECLAIFGEKLNQIIKLES